METWIVTGANRGIGRGVCDVVIARGDRVIALVRDADAAAALADDWRAFGERARVIVCDVTDDASVQAAAAQSAGPVDVIVNNAGVSGPRVRQELADDNLDGAGVLAALDVNALGPVRVVKAFYRRLRESNRPRVILVSSLMGALDRPGAGNLAYRISKAAANKAMQTLSAEAEDVAFIAVRPGSVRTRMNPEGPMEPAEAAKRIVAHADVLSVGAPFRFLDVDGSELRF